MARDILPDTQTAKMAQRPLTMPVPPGPLVRLWLRLSQWGFPFSLPSSGFGNPAMTRLREMGRRRFFASAPFYKRWPAKVAMSLAWPVGAGWTVRRNLSSPKALASGRSKILLALDAWWLAVRHNVPPLEYFTYRLWLPEQRKHIDDFVYWTESGNINAALNLINESKITFSIVSNKIAFHDFCQKNAFPTPEVLALFRRGEAVRPFAGGRPPDQDLWLKPARGKGGTGAERWRHDDGAYLGSDGQRLDAAAMGDHIATHSRKFGATLVQPVLTNHPDIQLMTNGALSTMRIISGCNSDGSVELVMANIGLPRDQRITVQGGDLAMVDLSTGVLGPCHSMIDRESALSHHPDTGVRVEGVSVPDWKDAVTLVKNAHSLLCDHVFLGWDVAFTDKGPILIEANAGWGALHLQMLSGKALGQTRFADIAAQYVTVGKT